MLRRYQGDRRGTLGPLHSAEVLRATEYYFKKEHAKDDISRLILWVCSFDEEIYWYDDYDPERHPSYN